jgi:2-polyprenyl-3-methyl-5-hydroxy-6-metoxy-1,4-benzoquinol methylase
MSSSNPIERSIEVYDEKYRLQGMRSQRMYPNESLIQFLASRYFALDALARRQIRILEVGCGTGANLWMMCKEGFEVCGIDSSQEAIQLAEAHLRDKWGVTSDLAVGSFMDLPYEADQFDVVVDVVSLQGLTLSDSAKALKGILRVIKPGGALFSYRLSDRSDMFATNEERLDDVTLANVSNSKMPLANNGPLSFWSPDVCQKVYAQVGLTVDEVERIGRTYANGAFVEYLKIIGSKR